MAPGPAGLVGSPTQLAPGLAVVGSRSTADDPGLRFKDCFDPFSGDAPCLADDREGHPQVGGGGSEQLQLVQQRVALVDCGEEPTQPYIRRERCLTSALHFVLGHNLTADRVLPLFCLPGAGEEERCTTDDDDGVRRLGIVASACGLPTSDTRISLN